MSNICIIPAGSQSGQACLAELTKSPVPNTSIRCCVRTPRTFPPAVEVISGIDGANPNTLKVFENTSSALIVTPHDMKAGFNNDSEMTCNMIQAASDAGVGFVVLVGSWTVNHPDKVGILAKRFMEPESLLKKLEETKGLKWCVLRGGYFVHNLGMMKGAIKNTGHVTVPMSTISPIHTRDIGRCAATVLREGPEKHHGKCYEMNGPEQLTIVEVMGRIGKVIGKEIQVSVIKAEEVQGPPFVKELALWMEKGGSNATPFTQDVGSLIGADQWTTVSDWAEENKANLI